MEREFVSIDENRTQLHLSTNNATTKFIVLGDIKKQYFFQKMTIPASCLS